MTKGEELTMKAWELEIKAEKENDLHKRSDMLKEAKRLRLEALDYPLENTGGKIALTAVVLMLCGVLVFLFWAMCKTVLQGMPQ